MASIYMPYIIERSSRGERTYDIFSRLLMDRIVFLGSPINDDVANIIIAQMLFLEADNPEKPIHLYINSPGGSVSAGLAMYDTMQFIKPDVSTLCMGMAASMGAFLLAAGAKGKRSSLTHSRIMIHQPLGGARGQASDIRIQAVPPLLDAATALLLKQVLADLECEGVRLLSARRAAGLLLDALRGLDFVPKL